MGRRLLRKLKVVKILEFWFKGNLLYGKYFIVIGTNN